MFNLYTLEKSITKHMDAARVPGLALAVIQDGEIIYARGFGVTSVEEGGVAVTPETLFRIGSTTKALTGTALMRLVEAGKLELDRPVSAYLDWLALSEPGAVERVTLRMLLSHTTGLPTDVPLHEQRDPNGLEAFMRDELPRYPLTSSPGKCFSYSNLNLMIAGLIAQNIYGKPYPEMMRELLFDPLSMKHTTFDPLVAMTYPLAHGHVLREDGTLAVEHRFLENTAGYPAGFAISTALDMAHFALLHLNQGQAHELALLSAETLASMQRPHAQLFTRKERQYGLTLCLESYWGRRMVGHDGTIGSFGCQFALLPDDGIGAVLLYNRLDLDGPGIVYSIFDRLLGVRRKVISQTRGRRGDTKPVGSGRTRWAAYAGTYLSPYIGLVNVLVEKNRLLLELYDERIVLTPLRKHLYAGTWGEGGIEVTVGFVMDPDGSVQYIVVNPYGDDTVFHLVECRRIKLDSECASKQDGWEAYTGIYSHPELGSYRVAIENGQCVLTMLEEEEQTVCTVVGKGQIACRWGVFEFEIDDNGRVDRMEHKGHRVFFQKVEGSERKERVGELLRERQ